MNSLFSKHVLATISCLALLSFPLAAISQNATKVISPPQGVANYALVQAIINKVKVKNPALKSGVFLTQKIMNKTQILGIIRHVLTFGAGFLVASGKLDLNGAETIIGAALALVGSVWSVISPEKQS